MALPFLPGYSFNKTVSYFYEDHRQNDSTLSTVEAACELVYILIEINGTLRFNSLEFKFHMRKTVACMPLLLAKKQNFLHKGLFVAAFRNGVYELLYTGRVKGTTTGCPPSMS